LPTARFAQKNPGDILMRKFALLAIVAASMAAAACNTISGAGKDVSAAGSAVTSTANDAKH
jgi:predicted small secreted protein